MKTKSKKKGTTAGSKDWTVKDFERSLARRQALEVDFDGMVNEMEREIAAVRDKYGQDLADLHVKVVMETGMQMAWMTANKATFDGPPRSITFACGTAGYRLGQEHLKPFSKWTWEKVLENLQVMNPAFVRQVPEVNREQLLAQKDDFGKDGLAVLGLKVVQDDKPYIEIKRDQTADQVAATEGAA